VSDEQKVLNRRRKRTMSLPSRRDIIVSPFGQKNDTTSFPAGDAFRPYPLLPQTEWSLNEVLLERAARSTDGTEDGGTGGAWCSSSPPFFLILDQLKKESWGDKQVVT
jgi:hypothetical protein